MRYLLAALLLWSFPALAGNCVIVAYYDDPDIVVDQQPWSTIDRLTDELPMVTFDIHYDSQNSERVSGYIGAEVYAMKFISATTRRATDGLQISWRELSPGAGKRQVWRKAPTLADAVTLSAVESAPAGLEDSFMWATDVRLNSIPFDANYNRILGAADTALNLESCN